MQSYDDPFLPLCSNSLACGIYFKNNKHLRPEKYWNDDELGGKRKRTSAKAPQPTDTTITASAKKRKVDDLQEVTRSMYSQSSPLRKTGSSIPGVTAKDGPCSEALIETNDANVERISVPAFNMGKENTAPTNPCASHQTERTGTTRRSPQKSEAQATVKTTPTKKKESTFIEDLLRTPSRFSSAFRSVTSPSPWRSGIFASGKKGSPSNNISTADLMSPQTKTLTRMLDIQACLEPSSASEMLLPSSPPFFPGYGNETGSQLWSELVTSPVADGHAASKVNSVAVDFDAFMMDAYFED